MADASPIRLAVIGCGAISERGHLPAALAVPQARVAALVDKDRARAEKLALKHPGAVVTDDYRTVAGGIDAAVVALPPSLHAPVTIDLLQRGVHVLVEKPMARTVTECDQMIAAARESGTVLAVGLVRRFRWAYRFAEQLIASGALGSIESFDVHEGGVFDWPIASPFFLKRDAAGGGVFADAGVHVIDALLWWFGDVTGFEYRDDAFGGVEADCELRLEMAGPVARQNRPVRGCVQLSRTRSMRNTTIIRGTSATLEIHAFTNEIRLTTHSAAGEGYALAGDLSRHCTAMPQEPAGENIMADQLADFVDAIRAKRPATVTGEEGRRSVAVIEACYAQRKPLHHAWVFEGVPNDSPFSRGALPRADTQPMISLAATPQGARVQATANSAAPASIAAPSAQTVGGAA